MSPTADVMAIVLFVFFAVGVAVGVVVVIALSARRVDTANRRNRRPRTPDLSSGYFADDDEPGDEPDEPRWWQTRD